MAPGGATLEAGPEPDGVAVRSANELWARGLRALQGGAGGGEDKEEEAASHGAGDAASAEAPSGLEALLRSLELDPSHADRFYFAAVLLIAQDRGREAAQCLEASITLDPKDECAYLELVMLFESVRRQEDARAVARRAIAAGARWADEWQYCPSFLPGLTSKAWWPKEHFPWASELEAAYSDIKEELFALTGSSGGSTGVAADWERVGEADGTFDSSIVEPGGVWRELRLYGSDDDAEDGGGTSEQHSGSGDAALPKTRALLERLLPGAVAMARLGAGEIIFSALAPGTRLAPHCAPSNVRLTCHLGLVCPEGARLRVGSEWRTWREGECLFFDDSFEHEVVHNGDSVRVVLLIRFWHPELPPERWMPALEECGEAFQRLAARRSVAPANAEVQRLLQELQESQ